MPASPPRPCRSRGCANLTQARNGYCEEHQSLDCGWNKPGRGSSTERGYGGRWRRQRKRIMRRDKGLCQPCLSGGRVTPATDVDHVIPKFEGGTDKDSNLQAICNPCHKLKTQAESQRAKSS